MSVNAHGGVSCDKYADHVKDGKVIELATDEELVRIKVKSCSMVDYYNSNGEYVRSDKQGSGHGPGCQSGPVSEVSITGNEISVTKGTRFKIDYIEVCTRRIVENHDLTIVPVCKDEEKDKYIWNIYSNDELDRFYPVKLGYTKHYNGKYKIPIAEVLNYNNDSSNPLTFETNESKIFVYWKNSLTNKWIYEGKASSNGEICEQPAPEETHTLKLSSMCKDEESEQRVWRVFHRDSSDMYFPVQLGYEVYSGSINSITSPFEFTHNEVNRFENPFLFYTPLNSDEQTVKLYWWNDMSEKWVYADVKAANNELCEKPEEPIIPEEPKEKEEDDDDNGDILGEKDEKVTTVVYAKTGASDNTWVYVGQAVLLSSTLGSTIVLVKKIVL